MTRSLKKGPYIDKKLLKKVQRMRAEKRDEPIKTWARNCTIFPEMIGLTFLVHNGKEFISVKVQENMVGEKLGEFSPTTKFSKHGGKMQREMESKAAKK